MFLDTLCIESNTEGRFKPRSRRIILHELTNNNAGSWSKQGPHLVLDTFVEFSNKNLLRGHSVATEQRSGLKCSNLVPIHTFPLRQTWRSSVSPLLPMESLREEVDIEINNENKGS